MVHGAVHRCPSFPVGNVHVAVRPCACMLHGKHSLCTGRACEAASQHLVRLLEVQRLKPRGRCIARQEHVGTRVGDRETFFNDTDTLPEVQWQQQLPHFQYSQAFLPKGMVARNKKKKKHLSTMASILQ